MTISVQDLTRKQPSPQVVQTHRGQVQENGEKKPCKVEQGKH